MGNFRSNARGGFGRGRSSGGRGGFGNRSGGRGGGRGGFGSRGSFEMHDATCDKCGKKCQVPFKPTGNKPVLCSDCFKKRDDSGNRFDSRDRGQGQGQSGVSSEQLNQINAKLDKILRVLSELELDVDEEEMGDEDDDMENDLDEDVDEEEMGDEDDDEADEDSETVLDR